MVRFLSAVGAIFLLITLARTATFLAAPHGREQLLAQIAAAGVPKGTENDVLLVYGILIVLIEAALVAAHGLAYYTIPSRRLVAWATALVLAQLWSFLLVGIPITIALVRPDIRRQFGLEA